MEKEPIKDSNQTITPTSTTPKTQAWGEERTKNALKSNAEKAREALRLKREASKEPPIISPPTTLKEVKKVESEEEEEDSSSYTEESSWEEELKKNIRNQIRDSMAKRKGPDFEVVPIAREPKRVRYEEYGTTNTPNQRSTYQPWLEYIVEHTVKFVFGLALATSVSAIPQILDRFNPPNPPSTNNPSPPLNPTGSALSPNSNNNAMFNGNSIFR
jgi:hypothetical protein